MKAWKIITVAALAVVAVALITASALAYNNRFLSSFGSQQNGMMGNTTPYGYPNGYPQTTYPTQSTQPTQTTTPYYPPQYGGWGCGCMRGGPYGSSAPYYPTSVTYANQITIDQAVTIAKGYLTSLNNPDLAVSQVEEYTQNFYVSYYEKSTGIGAFQMLIDKYTGSISPEMGPNMIWNTKYGMMRGMMGGWIGTPTTPMTITVDQARTTAQQFLNTYYSGTTVGDVTPFYGYYHVEVLLSGNTYGMLSVNGYTGQVWYHTWHGTFIQEWQP